MLELNKIVNQGIYFFFGSDSFYHCSICVAEGLKELGIPIFSNKNYWLDIEDKTYLFVNDESVVPSDCAIIIIDISDYESTGIINHFDCDSTDELIHVMINQSDLEPWFPEFNNAKCILRTHMNKLMNYPSNFVPWAFGISNRIRNSTANAHNFSDRKQEALVNFRPSRNQSIRLLMEHIFVPHLSNLFNINRTMEIEDFDNNFDSNDYFYKDQLQNHQLRHNKAYFSRLKTAKLCCSYGGNFIYSELFTEKFPQDTKLQFPIIRWDSWRFWESLAAGCVTIHLDFKKYGFNLPVMPKNWHHYIGVDLNNPKEAIERINDEPDKLSSISIEGKKWALKNYSSLATACRFLDIVTGEEIGTTKDIIAFINDLNNL